MEWSYYYHCFQLQRNVGLVLGGMFFMACIQLIIRLNAKKPLVSTPTSRQTANTIAK